MATLTVWKYASADGAERALETVEQLQREELVELLDGAVVTWPEGKKKPKTRQLHNMAGTGALGGGFWGLLFGLIFFVPLLGAAIGVGMGALMGSLTDVGIDDGFIKDVRNEVTPGTSALFLMTQNAIVDKVREAFEGQERPQLIKTNLSDEQEARLREAFAEE